MSDVELPKGIGPHEGIEFDLMRAGEKHVALFFEIEPDGLAAILSAGFQLLKFPQFTHGDVVFWCWIVYRPTAAGDAQRLKALVLDNSRGLVPEREHEIGRILSYTAEQVDAFVAHAASR